MRTATIERKPGSCGKFRVLRLIVGEDYVGELRCVERACMHTPGNAAKLYGKMDRGRTRPFSLEYVKDGARHVITSSLSLNRLEWFGILYIPIRIGLAGGR